MARQRSMNMKSKLAAFLRAQLDQRGWSLSEAEARSDVPKTTISQLINKPGTLPDLTTLVRLSNALEIPLEVLVEQTGITVSRQRTNVEEQERRLAMLQAVPALLPVLPRIAALPAAQQQAILQYIEFVLEQQPGREHE